MATRKYTKLYRNKSKPFISKKNRNKKKYNKTRVNIRRRGGMPSGKGKTVRFGEERIKEFATAPSYTDEYDEMSSISHYRRCPHPKYITPTIFPCRHKNTVFKNYDEYMEWVNLKRAAVSAETSHGRDMLGHYRNVRDEELKSSGRWNKYIPPEYRIYNEETGEINDSRLFQPDSDEERMILAEQRQKRNKEKEQWLQDVAKFKRERVVLNNFMDPYDY
jgi:hypothetical protein